MLNRRLTKDDRRGVNEPLNETNSFGKDISVPATFYLQYFNYSSEKS